MKTYPVKIYKKQNMHANANKATSDVFKIIFSWKY